MRKYLFKIISPDGIVKEIIAKCKSEAITLYLKDTGMPLDFFKQHCSIKKLGLTKE